MSGFIPVKRFAACLLALAGLAGGVPAFAVPVIPGASGFGIDTPAGRGGTVYRVTNLNESGTGSLRACTDASGPRVCIFEVSGAIRLTDDLVIRNPNITIAGQTAPSPGIMIRGGGVIIYTSDVLIQHIRIRPGDDPAGPAPDNRDAISIGTTTRVQNVVIDHVSLSWGTDETASVYWDWDSISFLNTIFGAALDDSIHPEAEGATTCPCTPHGYGPLMWLVGANHKARLSMIGNLFIHQVGRNPLSGVPSFAFVNNVVYNAQAHQVNLATEPGKPTDNSIVGNVFINGPNSWRSWNPVLLGGYENPLLSGSHIYLADNASDRTTSDPWSVASFQGGGSPGDYNVTSPPSWPSGLVAKRTAGDEALNYVLSNVGARPADRDAYDRGLVNEVKTRGGQIINCVSADGSARCSKNAGGWPAFPQNTRRLTLPSNPNSVGSDGYTNLEKWLQGMAAEVEGKAARPLPPANARAE